MNWLSWIGLGKPRELQAPQIPIISFILQIHSIILICCASLGGGPTRSVCSLLLHWLLSSLIHKFINSFRNQFKEEEPNNAHSLSLSFFSLNLPRFFSKWRKEEKKWRAYEWVCLACLSLCGALAGGPAHNPPKKNKPNSFTNSPINAPSASSLLSSQSTLPFSKRELMEEREKNGVARA